MNKRTVEYLAAGLLCASFLAVVVVAASRPATTAEEHEPMTSYMSEAGYLFQFRGEFACYTADALSARHVEVVGARLLPDSGGLWAIYYADGPVDYYRQRDGEACRMEDVGPQGGVAP